MQDPRPCKIRTSIKKLLGPDSREEIRKHFFSSAGSVPLIGLPIGLQQQQQQGQQQQQQLLLSCCYPGGTPTTERQNEARTARSDEGTTVQTSGKTCSRNGTATHFFFLFAICLHASWRPWRLMETLEADGDPGMDPWCILPIFFFFSSFFSLFLCFFEPFVCWYCMIHLEGVEF